MSKLSTLAGGAIGYVLGARAGRDRYEQIKGQAQRVWQDPRVQTKAAAATDVAKEKASSVVDLAKEKTSSTRGETVYVAPVVDVEPSNNEGPDNRQPAPPMGI
jgi:SLT domain-containing protein